MNMDCSHTNLDAQEAQFRCAERSAIFRSCSGLVIDWSLCGMEDLGFGLSTASRGRHLFGSHSSGGNHQKAPNPSVLSQWEWFWWMRTTISYQSPNQTKRQNCRGKRPIDRECKHDIWSGVPKQKVGSIFLFSFSLSNFLLNLPQQWARKNGRRLVLINILT